MNKNLRIILFMFLASSQTAIASEDPWQQSHALEAQMDYAGAVQSLQPILNKNRKHEFALTRYAWLSYLQKEYNVSYDYYRQALEVNPQSLDAQLGITLPLMAQGRWQEAATYAKKTLQTAPYQYYAHVRLMACEEALLEWNALFDHATKLSRIYPTDATILVYQARAASVSGKSNIAIEAYKGVLERSPGHLEAIRYLASNNIKL